MTLGSGRGWFVTGTQAPGLAVFLPGQVVEVPKLATTFSLDLESGSCLSRVYRGALGIASLEDADAGSHTRLPRLVLGALKQARGAKGIVPDHEEPFSLNAVESDPWVQWNEQRDHLAEVSANQ
jgi:hypothetical protein